MPFKKFIFWTILSYNRAPIASFVMWESALSLSGSDPAYYSGCKLLPYKLFVSRGPLVATISWQIACRLRPLGHHGRLNYSFIAYTNIEHFLQFFGLIWIETTIKNLIFEGNEVNWDLFNQNGEQKLGTLGSSSTFPLHK